MLVLKPDLSTSSKGVTLKAIYKHGALSKEFIFDNPSRDLICRRPNSCFLSLLMSFRSHNDFSSGRLISPSGEVISLISFIFVQKK